MGKWAGCPRLGLGRQHGNAPRRTYSLTPHSQFGFNGDDIWIQRRDTLFASLHSNPKAKFMTRVVQFGSEPLYDNVLPHQQLAEQVELAKANLSSLSIPVTVSELAYG